MPGLIRTRLKIITHIIRRKKPYPIHVSLQNNQSIMSYCMYRKKALAVHSKLIHLILINMTINMEIDTICDIGSDIALICPQLLSHSLFSICLVAPLFFLISLAKELFFNFKNWTKGTSPPMFVGALLDFGRYLVPMHFQHLNEWFSMTHWIPLTSS